MQPLSILRIILGIVFFVVDTGVMNSTFQLNEEGCQCHIELLFTLGNSSRMGFASKLDLATVTSGKHLGLRVGRSRLESNLSILMIQIFPSKTYISEDIRDEFTKFGPLITHNSVSDGWIWRGSAKGVYSVKSGYEWLSAHDTSMQTPLKSWNWIWRLPCPEKVIFLIWFILNNALPTNMLRHERKLALNPICSICGTDSEDWIHCLFECTWAHNLWMSVGFNISGFLLQIHSKEHEDFISFKD